jgi:hypothetical protein
MELGNGIRMCVYGVCKSQNLEPPSLYLTLCVGSTKYGIGNDEKASKRNYTLVNITVPDSEATEATEAPSLEPT